MSLFRNSQIETFQNVMFGLKYNKLLSAQKLEAWVMWLKSCGGSVWIANDDE